MEVACLSTNPSIAVPGTERERRSFDFFRIRTGRLLAEILDLTHLNQFILQAGHSSSALRSAMISLGSIGERLLINPALTWENQQANACHEFARLQYGLALRKVRAQIDQCSEQPLEFVTVACLLFTAFEYLQGNRSASQAHLRGGWEILSQESNRSPGDSQSQSAQAGLRHEIRRAFTGVYKQAAPWLGLASWSSPALVSYDSLMPPSSSVQLNEFSTVEDASFSFIHILNEIFHQSRRMSGGKHSTASSTKVQHQHLLSKLQEWHVHFKALRDQLGTAMDVETLHRIFVMEMNYITFSIDFGTCSETQKTHWYSQKEPDFRQVITLATAVVLPITEEVTKRMLRVVLANNGARTDDDMYANPTALFAFYVGIIPPLFAAATKSQNSLLRAEAIALLKTRPWREGSRDSMAMAQLAQRRAATGRVAQRRVALQDARSPKGQQSHRICNSTEELSTGSTTLDSSTSLT